MEFYNDLPCSQNVSTLFNRTIEECLNCEKSFCDGCPKPMSEKAKQNRKQKRAKEKKHEQNNAERRQDALN